MGDLESLLLVLGLIYLSDCLVWVRHGAIVFKTFTGKSFRILFPGTLWGNHRGALLLANPLPPLGAVFTCQLPPFSISTETAFAYSPACLDPAGRPIQTGNLVSFDEFREAEADGRSVLVNGSSFLSAISTFAARNTAEGLNSIGSVPKFKRAEKIRFLVRNTLNAKEVENHLKKYQVKTRLLRLLSNGLFIFLFFLFTPVVLYFGLGSFELMLLAGAFVQSVVIAILFRRLHKAMYADAHEERFKTFLVMLLAPPTAIRAPDILARPLFERYHPLAIAKILAKPDEFRGFARRFLLDLHYPVLPSCPTKNPTAEAAVSFFTKIHLQAAEDFLEECGENVKKLIASELPSEPENQSFCPRCGTQFVTHSGNCGDCGGRSLHLFQKNEKMK